MQTVIATISAAVSSIAAILALVFVSFQLRNQNRQLRQTALTSLHEQLLRPDIQRAIRTIYAAEPQELEQPQSLDILEQIELVLNQYDLIGSRIKCGVVPEQQTLETEWPVVLRLDHQLRPFLIAEARLRGDAPYKPGFELLVAKATQYRNRHFPTAFPAPFPRNFPALASHPTTSTSARQPVRLVFISGHEFGERCLMAMLSSDEYLNHQAVFSLLVSVSQAPALATVGVTNLQRAANQFSLPHITVESVKSETIYERVLDAKPDFILAIGLSELIPTKVLDIPKTVTCQAPRHSNSHGVIGMHPTPLPIGRGRAPIPWAIIKNLQTTGVTVFMLEEEADSGGIVLQRMITLDPKETATSLFAKVSLMHEKLARQLMPLLTRRELTWRDQDPSAASVWPRRTKKDGLINFLAPADTIDRLIRALTPPYPGAYFHYKGERISVLGARVVADNSTGAPGRVEALTVSGAPIIRCGKDMLELTRLEPPDHVAFVVGDLLGGVTVCGDGNTQ
jgi:methionyl-tRNA formyltransferase